MGIPAEGAIVAPTEETKWLKRVLFPFWICRILLLVLMATAYIAAMYWIGQEVEVRGGLLAATILVVLLCVLCVSLDLASMMLLAQHALKPLPFLVSTLR